VNSGGRAGLIAEASGAVDQNLLAFQTGIGIVPVGNEGLTMTDVRAVVFDIGNILLRWEPEVMLRDYFAGDAAVHDFLHETRLMWTNLEFDAGRPFADGVAELAAAFPHHSAPLKAFDTRWRETVTGAIADNVATLEALKDAGHTVHAITNFSRQKFDVARAAFPFLDLFGHTLVSGDVGLVKPDYRIYHRFCRDTGLRPEELIFVDDSAVNIAAAKAIGYRTFHMPKADAAECAAFRAELRTLGFRI
jgi:2-haloacid dehalogenase